MPDIWLRTVGNNHVLLTISCESVRAGFDINEEFQGHNIFHIFMSQKPVKFYFIWFSARLHFHLKNIWKINIHRVVTCGHNFNSYSSDGIRMQMSIVCGEKILLVWIIPWWMIVCVYLKWIVWRGEGARTLTFRYYSFDLWPLAVYLWIQIMKRMSVTQSLSFYPICWVHFSVHKYDAEIFKFSEESLKNFCFSFYQFCSSRQHLNLYIKGLFSASTNFVLTHKCRAKRRGSQYAWVSTAYFRGRKSEYSVSLISC